MKKFLLLAFCFFTTQMNSCGSIEVYAETTKLTITNNSTTILLQNVRCGGADFGDIGKNGESSTREISIWENIKITFEVNGNSYYTEEFGGKEYRLFKYTFEDNTSVIGYGTSSYALGDLENGDTQYAIYNGSQALLKNVRWSGANFGDIKSKESSERKIVTTYGRDDIRFEVNGKEYSTYDFFESKQFRHFTHQLNDDTSIIDDTGTPYKLGRL